MSKKIFLLTSFCAMNTIHAMEVSTNKAKSFRYAPLSNVTISDDTQHLYGTIPTCDPSIWQNVIEKFEFSNNAQPLAQWRVGDNRPHEVLLSNDEQTIAWSTRLIDQLNPPQVFISVYKYPQDNVKEPKIKVITDIQNKYLTAIAMDPLGEDIAYALNDGSEGNSIIKLIDTAGKAKNETPLDQKPNWLSFDPGSKIIAGALQTKVCLWNAQNNICHEMEIKGKKPYEYISFIKMIKNRACALLFDDPSALQGPFGQVVVIDPERLEITHNFENSYNANYKKADFSQEGNLFAACDNEGFIYIYDLREDKAVSRIYSELSEAQDYDIKFCTNNDVAFACVNGFQCYNHAEKYDLRNIKYKYNEPNKDQEQKSSCIIS